MQTEQHDETLAPEALPVTAARTGDRRREKQKGITLVLVLVAITALTVLGVTSITTSSTDTMITHNMRRMDQAHYAAIAGMEHARRNLILGVMPTSNQTSYFDESSASTSYYIDSTNALSMATNGTPLGTYTVKAISVKCSGAPPGYSVDQFYSQYFDLQSTGIIKDTKNSSVLPASATSVLTVRKVADGRCYRR